MSFPALWNTSIPTIIVGLSLNGKLEIAQGIPPILAHIYTSILLHIDLSPLPLSIVFSNTTYDGTGFYSNKYNLISLYNGAPFLGPGNTNTAAYTVASRILISYFQSYQFLDFIGHSLGYLAGYL